jgi:hypothetical protein
LYFPRPPFTDRGESSALLLTRDGTVYEFTGEVPIKVEFDGKFTGKLFLSVSFCISIIYLMRPSLLFSFVFYIAHA